jgi:hypothetical protein
MPHGKERERENQIEPAHSQIKLMKIICFIQKINSFVKLVPIHINTQCIPTIYSDPVKTNTFIILVLKV